MDSSPTKDRHKLEPYLMVLAGVLLWSTGGLFIKYTSLDAVTVNLGRSLFAAITVAAFTYKKGLKPDGMTIITSLLYAGTLSCFVYANKNTTAVNAIFLQYTAPVYILILSPFILNERFHARDLITVVLCLAGMSMFFVGTNTAQATAPNEFGGNIAALASGVFFGLYFIFLRHPRSLSANPAISVFYGNLFIVLLMLPLVYQSFANGQQLTPVDLGAVAYLGIFQIGIAYILFTSGIASGVRSMDGSVIGFIEPLLNPVWVFLFVGERPSNYAIIGSTVILATVILHTLIQFRTRTSSDEPFPGTN